MPAFQKRDQRQILGSPSVLVNQNSNAGNQWFGRTAVGSDTLGMTAVVSTALVNSSSVIGLTMQCHMPNSNATAQPFCVGTISPGGFFTITTAASCTQAGSYTAMWEIKNPKP